MGFFLWILLFSIGLSFSGLLSGQVIETEQGRVEFLGLERWTVDALMDSMHHYSPSTSLHACAAVLKQKLGFAEAAVMHYHTTEGRYTVITVVESHRHEGVQYLEQPSGTILPNTAWTAGIRLTHHPQEFSLGLQSYEAVLAGKRDSMYTALDQFTGWGVQPDTIAALWAFLQQHQQRRNRCTGSPLLRHSSICSAGQISSLSLQYSIYFRKRDLMRN